jgi:ligand-binding SRPBCC domain-containing protein
VLTIPFVSPGAPHNLTVSSSGYVGRDDTPRRINPLRITIKPMAQRFESRQWVPYPVELVFAFFANPSNLPFLMPPQQQARIEDVRLNPPPPRPVAKDPERRFRSVAAGVGTEIILSFRPVVLLPQRVGWTARIVEFEWNSHFADEQIKGPFKRFHHRHGIQREIRDGVEGTTVSDAVDYDLPLGALGKLGSGFVRAQMEKGWQYRQKRLPEILAAAARQAVQRA